jgi:hypothetical protein
MIASTMPGSGKVRLGLQARELVDDQDEAAEQPAPDQAAHGGRARIPVLETRQEAAEDGHGYGEDQVDDLAHSHEPAAQGPECGRHDPSLDDLERGRPR